MAPSAASTADRSDSNDVTAPSTAEVRQVEAAVRALDEQLHLRLGARELRGRGAQSRDPFREELERAVEFHPLALELRDDLLQAGERLLERHALTLPRRRCRRAARSRTPSDSRAVRRSPWRKRRRRGAAGGTASRSRSRGPSPACRRRATRPPRTRAPVSPAG